ncbi:MAG: cyclic nucleotide-binding domain-containing protein [Pseudomonadota bacterium]
MQKNKNINHLSLASRREFSLNEKATMIDDSIWGNSLNWPDIEYIAQYFDVYELKPKLTILNEGSRLTPYMGLILSGKVSIVKTDTIGIKKNIATIGKGRTFGEMSVIDGLISSAYVITKTDVMLMVLDKDNFHQLIDNSPGIGNKFLLMLLKLMSSRIRETSGKLVEYVDV